MDLAHLLYSSTLDYIKPTATSMGQCHQVLYALYIIFSKLDQIHTQDTSLQLHRYLNMISQQSNHSLRPERVKHYMDCVLYHHEALIKKKYPNLSHEHMNEIWT